MKPPIVGYVNVYVTDFDAGVEFLGSTLGLTQLMAEDDSADEELAGQEVAFTQPPEKMPWGGYMALVQDGDGNVYYLDEASAGSH